MNLNYKKNMKSTVLFRTNWEAKTSKELNLFNRKYTNNSRLLGSWKLDLNYHKTIQNIINFRKDSLEATNWKYWNSKLKQKIKKWSSYSWEKDS